MLEFQSINVDQHRNVVLTFRHDSFVTSFGHAQDFNEGEYLAWLEDKQAAYPSGFVLVEEAGTYIGQLELSIRQYEDQKIGYVHLYYLIPEKRGCGLGKELNNYAMQFFAYNQVNEYHLRV